MTDTRSSPDIVERLRDLHNDMRLSIGGIANEAADEIERLRASNDQRGNDLVTVIAQRDVAESGGAAQTSQDARTAGHEEAARVCEGYFRTYEHQSPIMRAQHEAFGKLFAKTIRALFVVPPSPVAGEWRPIETAPRDIPIVVWDDPVMGEAYYDGEDDTWWWCNTGRGDYTARSIYPTLWHPMPTPPVSSTDGGTP